jgi:hypothetical protein
MLRASSLLSAAALALAGGLPVSYAADPPAQPVLQSEANSAGVPPFTLPSDKLPSSNLLPYLYRTDPTGQAVDNVQDPNIPTEITGQTDVQFLTYDNGGLPRLDTTQSACAYYRALGESITGVIGCGPKGELESIGGVVTFEQWKQDVKIDKYAPPGQTDVAHFINLVDLNLTRNHHLVSYGPDQLAGYVCNHPGPAQIALDPSGLFPTQPEVDGLIKNIASKSSLIACVAMEYSARAQPPGTRPFTKFFIFGANGDLLSTVDLDGHGPKGVPNVCTACHGGWFDYNVPAADGKSVQFSAAVTKLYYDPTQPSPALDAPSNIRPVGDLAAHFLPFDQENFVFSSKLQASAQDAAIFKLNLDVYTTEISRVHISGGLITADGLASASITDLISGWYQSNLAASNPAPGFYTGTVPVQWDSLGYNQIYLQSYAHSCRTCHAAMDTVPLEREPGLVVGSTVCAQHVMPNAKVTFDRFWLSDPLWNFPFQVPVPGQPATAPNQPGFLSGIAQCSPP